MSALSAQPACARCAYPIHASICPECGADLSSPNTRIDLASLQRELRVASLPSLFITLAPLIASLLSARLAGSHAIILNTLALLLLTLALAPLATRHAHSPSRAESLLRWARASFWLTLPLLFALPLLRLTALLRFDAILPVTLALSLPLLLWIALIAASWFAWRADWASTPTPNTSRIPPALAIAILTLSALSGFFWFPLAALTMLTW